MYSVGDFLVHPGQGVCRVEEVVPGPRGYYKLFPVTQSRPTHISYPLTREERLRPVITADEALKIIEDYSELEPEDFRAKNALQEEEHFKEIIRKGSCRDSVCIVKTMNCRIKECVDAGKKAPVAYGRVLKIAHKRSLTELAVALGKTPDEVAELISDTDTEANVGAEKITLYL